MDVVGYIAVILLIIGYIPQCWKIFLTNRTDDLSFNTFAIIFVGLTLLWIHGISINDIPIMLNGIIGSIQIGYIIYKILKNVNKRRRF